MKQSVWAGAPLARPTLTGSVEADLCVVGLGGSGLAAVERGLDLGMSVVGVEAHSVASGAAGKNGGFLLAGLAEFYHDLRGRLGSAIAASAYEQTKAKIDALAADPFARGRGHLRQVGSLRIAADDTEREDIAKHIQALREDNFPAEHYIGPEGNGLLIPEDGVFHPGAWCRARAERALSRGADLFENSPAVVIESGQIETASGQVRSRHIVVAVDGGLETIFPELVSRITTWRLQMLSTAPVERVVSSRAVYHRFGLDYWQQLPDGRLALGGGRDKGGDDERGGEAVTSPSVQSHLESLLRQRLDVHAPIEHRWAAHVGYTADALPLCDQVRPGVFALGGYCGTGNVVGALCAADAVSRVAGKATPFLDLMDRAKEEVGGGAP